MSRNDSPRRDARHRASFLAQVPSRLAALAAAGEDTTEGADVIAFELRQLAETAARLHLPDVAAAATRPGLEGWRERLRAVATAVAFERESTPFRPIALVAGAGSLPEGVPCSERVVVHPSSAAVRAAAVAELPQAAVLPATDLAEIQALSADGVLVVATGGPGWPARVAALASGAAAWLPEGELPTALSAIRWAAWTAGERPVAALAGPDATWTAALEGVGFSVIPRDEPEEVADHWPPDALVIPGPGVRLRGVGEAPGVLQALRAHPRLARLVIAANVPDADVLLAGNAPRAAAQVARAVDRIRRIPNDRDPVTGLANRLGALRSLDRLLAAAARSREPLAVAVLQLEGLDVVRSEHGLGAWSEALRAAAGELRGTLRRFDVVGRVCDEIFLAGLAGCGADEAAKRLNGIVTELQGALQRDARFAEILPRVGVADTAPGLERLLDRAWDSLAHARQGGPG